MFFFSFAIQMSFTFRTIFCVFSLFAVHSISLAKISAVFFSFFFAFIQFDRQRWSKSKASNYILLQFSFFPAAAAAICLIHHFTFFHRDLNWKWWKIKVERNFIASKSILILAFLRLFKYFELFSFVAFQRLSESLASCHHRKLPQEQSVRHSFHCLIVWAIFSLLVVAAKNTLN